MRQSVSKVINKFAVIHQSDKDKDQVIKHQFRKEGTDPTSKDPKDIVIKQQILKGGKRTRKSVKKMWKKMPWNMRHNFKILMLQDINKNRIPASNEPKIS